MAERTSQVASAGRRQPNGTHRTSRMPLPHFPSRLLQEEVLSPPSQTHSRYSQLSADPIFNAGSPNKAGSSTRACRNPDRPSDSPAGLTCPVPARSPLTARKYPTWTNPRRPLPAVRVEPSGTISVTGRVTVQDSHDPSQRSCFWALFTHLFTCQTRPCH